MDTLTAKKKDMEVETIMLYIRPWDVFAARIDNQAGKWNGESYMRLYRDRLWEQLVGLSRAAASGAAAIRGLYASLSS